MRVFERTEHWPTLDAAIESYIRQYDGTWVGAEIRNMYENGSSCEAICDKLGWDYEDYLSE